MCIRDRVNTDVLYFLEKPIDPDELVIALNKFEKKYLDLQKHITIKNTEGHFFMQLETIQYIKSEINYCNIYRTNPVSYTHLDVYKRQAIFYSKINKEDKILANSFNQKANVLFNQKKYSNTNRHKQ